MTLKLFVADDSVTIQKVIGLAFSDTDTVIESVASGDSVLDAIRVFRPDVVLADVCMPGINGYEICAQIKEHPDLSHIPVVLLVGTFEPFDESEASRVRCDACLTKPFDTSELVDVVQKLVGRDTMSPEKESAATVHSGEPGVFPNAAALNDQVLNTRIPISRQSLDSFLGSNRVLDVFDAGAAANAERRLESLSASFKSVETECDSPQSPPAVTADQLSEDILDAIVERVVKKMSAEIISEIAWEVVPELSEILIRRSIEEGRKS
jgi:CheY-like chemotaxis protein